ncbi:MAG: alpha/beta hydrolase [Myxococcota bacterium]
MNPIAVFVLLSSVSASEIRIERNLPYAAGVAADPARRLDLVVPKSTSPAPLLIWIGGGAWAYVDKDQEMPLARAFAREGIAVALIQHRLSRSDWSLPEGSAEGVEHPAHAEDVALAIRWLKDHAGRYRVNTKHMVLGGYSSGAHLSALIALDPTYLSAVGLKPSDLSGVVPVAGAYDITAWRAASPTVHVAGATVPMLLISERATYAYTTLLEKALRAAEVSNVDVLHVFGEDHGSLARSLAAQPSRYRDIVCEFVRSVG